MRTLSPELAAHVASGATTLATCWRIVRADGAVLGFTDHDRTLVFDGTDFAPSHGLDASQRRSRLGGQVDTGEVMGILDSEAITDDDIALGRYDGAVVETWRVNWRDATMRVKLRTDTIGEITREDGLFRAELRSPQHALNVPRGRTYQALCDVVLGDPACGVDIENPAFRANGAVTAVGDRHLLTISGLSGFEAGWFGFGSVRWTSGRRVGKLDRVLRHGRSEAGDALSFEEPVGDWVAIGDTLVAYAGCDRRAETCRAKFANMLNFRGFPHIPGNDYVLRYPRQGDNLDGRPLVR